MTAKEQERIEARLRAFERNADELWRVLHDVHLQALHLMEITSKAPPELLGASPDDGRVNGDESGARVA